MPKFRVELSATAIVEAVLTVRADSEEEAYDEALKRLDDARWTFAGLDGPPVELVDVSPIDPAPTA